LATAEPEDDAGFLALAVYETLKTIVARLATNFDIATSDGASYRLQQVFANAKALLEIAADNVAAMFGTAAGGSAGLVTMDLGFLDDDADFADVG
jgi:hypothetical protein